MLRVRFLRWRGRRRLELLLARPTGSAELADVVAHQRELLVIEVTQEAVRVDARVVGVVEEQAEGIMTHGLYGKYP